MKKVFLLIPLIFLFFSCGINIDTINYGEDSCDFCSMTIVDHKHAAQVVTNKGKNFKFDAVECMIHYLAEQKNENELAHILVANLLDPGNLMAAKESAYIISENIPSPMGANLSAVSSIEEAQKLKEENGGEVFDWVSIKNKIKM